MVRECRPRARRAGEGLARPQLDDGHVDAGEYQLAREHQPGWASAGNHHRVSRSERSRHCRSRSALNTREDHVTVTTRLVTSRAGSRTISAEQPTLWTTRSETRPRAIAAVKAAAADDDEVADSASATNACGGGSPLSSWSPSVMTAARCASTPLPPRATVRAARLRTGRSDSGAAAYAAADSSEPSTPTRTGRGNPVSAARRPVSSRVLMDDPGRDIAFDDPAQTPHAAAAYPDERVLAASISLSSSWTGVPRTSFALPPRRARRGRLQRRGLSRQSSVAVLRRSSRGCGCRCRR